MEKDIGLNMAMSLLTPLQAEKNPQFVQFLKDLFDNKVTTDFVTKSVADEREEVLKEYMKAEKQYNCTKLIYNCLWELIAECNPNDKVLKELKSVLISSELNESMRLANPNDSAEENVLHVFGKQVEKQLWDNDHQPWLHKQLRNKLMEKGVELLKHMGEDIDGNDHQLVFNKLDLLPSQISSQLETSNNLKKSQLENEQILQQQYSKYMSTLLESLKIMENLIKKHMMDIQMKEYEAKSDWLQVQCDALLLKIKSLHLEILCETYTKDTVPALRKILKDLEARQEQVDKETQECRGRLSRYESVGQDFNDIVKEYSQLREAIKSKKWTLEKLKSYRPPAK